VIHFAIGRRLGSIGAVLPKSKPRVDDRRLIRGILHILKTGARWRDAPPQYSPAKQSKTDCSMGTARYLAAHLRQGSRGRSIPDELMLDSSDVKAHRSAFGGKKGVNAGGRRIAWRQNNENPLHADTCRPDQGPRCRSTAALAE
jgi:transposase